ERSSSRVRPRSIGLRGAKFSISPGSFSVSVFVVSLICTHIIPDAGGFRAEVRHRPCSKNQKTRPKTSLASEPKSSSAAGFLFSGLLNLSKAGRGGLATTLARLLVVLVLASILQDAGLLDLFLEPSEGAVDGLARLDLDLCHSLPSFRSQI